MAEAGKVVTVREGFGSHLEFAVRGISNPASLRGAIAVIAGILVMLLPRVSSDLLQIVLIVALGLSAASDIAYAVAGRRGFRTPRTRRLALLRGVATAMFMVVLLLGPHWLGENGELRLAVVVAMAGVYVMVRGTIVVVHAVRRQDVELRAVRITGGITAICVGALAYLAPASTTTSLIAGAAVSAIVLGFILVAWGLRREEKGSSRVDPQVASLPEVLWDWIRESNIGKRRRKELAATLYFEHPAKFDKFASWWVMLVLSVAIATFAVLSDSTAVVIGAMLVAPLMVPILGLAGALVNGWTRRALQSALMVVGGVSVSILVSYAFAAWTPMTTALDTNYQITSRVNPNLLDMLIAIAAGAAGAFATVNPRVSASIAGVAIAVALVPPLAVVGVTLRAGNFSDAGGAFLLFLTNFVAIVIVAALVFILAGFARPRVLKDNPTKIIITVVPFVALAAIILYPLMFASQGIVTTAAQQRNAQTAVTDWMGDDSKMLVQSVAITGNEVTVSLIGSGDTPSVDTLQQSLFESLGEQVSVTLTVTPVTSTHVPVPSASAAATPSASAPPPAPPSATN
ncbi:DUF389 domain-containing protein [Demequina aurantiaca]|uniref:DUF389 domain-containing protein n=1 Tax=Demequina aurantiaca TaxID=676200 RepID=UPI003D338915